MRQGWLGAALTLAAVAGGPAFAETDYRALSRDMLRELVAFDTTAAHGTLAAMQAIQARLRREGFADSELTLLAPEAEPSRADIVVRLKGAGRAKPLLMIGHVDVVEAPRQGWSVDPFKLTEKDGYLYGRGTLDLKGEDVAVMTALIRMKREGFVPDRDIVAAFTADEEDGTANGAEWLLRTHRDLVDAALAINPDEGAAGERGGKRLYYGVQTSTKRYVTFTVEASGKTGHTAIPQADNAIYKLAAALVRLGALRFPVELDETTRAYFARMAESETGATRADMLAAGRQPPDLAAARRLADGNAERNATLRTTCVATMLKAGTEENALADTAQATVQCRLLPGDDPQAVQRTIIQALGRPPLKVAMTESGQPNPASPLTPALMARVTDTVHSMWPGLPVLPSLNIGASDSVYTRAAGIPTYGVCSIFYDLDDDRAHGDDERIGIAEFDQGVEFTYRLLKALSAA